MSTMIVDRFKETLKHMPPQEDRIVISSEESRKVSDEINNEMKEYRREFSLKEKQSQKAAAEILVTS